MVKTKVTSRTGARKCPMCSELCHGDVEFSNHVVQCAMQEYSCDFCDFTSQKECNVKRHMRRAHKGLLKDPLPLGMKSDTDHPASAKKMEDVSSKVDSDSGSEIEDWLFQDPGDDLKLDKSSVDKDDGDDDAVRDTTVNLLEGRLQFYQESVP
ncbi:hunchback-like protein [Ostrea edulis]|uniref:hunchback-like protein n=1 Tax=Ostrea edulis TaxID=37623 RepID=UPI0024AF685D|nr:hunchback-like protein [Ostrea edulis]